jgi:hypothetical protein
VQQVEQAPAGRVRQRFENLVDVQGGASVVGVQERAG